MNTLSPDILIAFLKKIELFKELKDDELSLIAGLLEEQDYEPGGPVFTESNPRKSLFLIADGEVEIYKKTPFGEEKRLSYFSRYDFLGEGSLMDDSPHSTSPSR